MKIKFITLTTLLTVLLSSSLQLSAQTGNVGIGTTSPTTKLDVNGGITTREAAAAITVGAGPVTIANLNYSQFRLTGATAPFTINGPTTNGSVALVAGARLVIVNASGETGTLNGFAIPTGTAQEFSYSGGAWIATNSGGSSAKSDYDWLKAGYNFPTNLADTGANIFHIGNVGIGVKTPTEKLHVETAIDNEGIALSQTARTNTVMLNSSAAGGYLGFINNSASTDATLTASIQHRDPNAASGFANDLVYNTPNGTHYFVQPVGIGTPNPTERLHVATPTSGEGIALSQTATASAIMLNSDANGVYLGFINNTANTDGAVTASIRQYEASSTGGLANDMVYTTTGNHYFRNRVSIFTATPDPAASLDVGGDAYSNSFRARQFLEADNLDGAGTREVGANADGVLVIFPSDGTLKKEITDVSEGLDKVMQLHPVYFNWKDTAMYGEQREVGLIAQEVKEVVPEVTGTFKKDGEEYQTIAYTKLVPVLAKAIQEQQALIDAQNKRIAELEKKVNKLVDARTKQWRK